VIGEAGRTASHLVGRTHAYPLTVAQSGIVDCSRPYASRDRWLFWVMLPGAVQILLADASTTPNDDLLNGVDTHLCAPLLA